MRKIKFIEPIESIQGKLCGHSRMIFAKGNQNQNEGNQWWQMRCNSRNTATHPVSAAESRQRTRFKEVAAAVRTRMNATTREQDLAAMKAANFSGTFRQYLWSLELAKWDQLHPSA